MAMTLRASRLRLTQAIYFGEPPGGGGTGSVTSIGNGNGIVPTPSPLTTTGRFDLSFLTSDWAAGNYNINSRNSRDGINLTAYGAVPNGVFDNTAVLTAAVAALPASGGDIYIPNGTCYFASTITLTKPVNFFGSNPGNSRMFFNNALDGLVFTHASGQGVTLEDIDFGQQGPGPATAGVLVRCASVANFPIRINRCFFLNHFVGVSLESNWFSNITDSTFVGGATAGGSDIVVDNLVHMDQGGLRISGCWFTGQATYNVRQRAGGGTTVDNNYFLSLAGNNICSVYLDLIAGKTTSDLVIYGNNFEGAPSAASIILGPGGTFTNIQIQGNEIATFPSVTAIQVKPLATGNVHYTLCQNNTMWQGDYGVEFAPVGAGTVDSFRIDGNMFSEQVIAAIKTPAVPATIDRLEIGENTFLKAGAAVYFSGLFSATSGFQQGHFKNIAISSEDWTPTNKLEIVGENNNGSARIFSYQNTNVGPSVVFRSTPGTIGAETATQAGNVLSWIGAGGHDGTNFTLSQAALNTYAAETFTPAAQGMGIDFYTTLAGGTTISRVMRISDKGWVSINPEPDPNADPLRELDLGGVQRFRGIAAPTVSEPNSGTIYFDAGSNTLKASLNGGAYTNIIGSGGLTGSGTATKISYWTAATNVAGAANIYADAVNHRFGVKVAVPNYTVDVDGDINQSAGSAIRIGGSQVFKSVPASATTAIGTGISANIATNSVAFGKNSLAVATALSTGTTAIGTAAGTAITDGIRNTSVGSSVLDQTTTGNRNTAIGYAAGHTNTTGSNNVFLGGFADANAGNYTNAVAIGASAVVGASNSMVLGDSNMKVGIRISTPSVTLDVAGALATRHYDLTLVNGANDDIALLDSSWVRIIGPTAGFSISGFANGVDGRHLTIFNTTTEVMTITNLATSGATNQIDTLTGGDVVLAARKTSATFIYEDASDKWILVGYNG